jgi:uncharacterized protein
VNASRLLGPILVVAAAAAVIVLLVWVFQRKLIYIPFVREVPPAAAVLPGAREVRFTTTDGLTLNGWLVPPVDGLPKAAVLVFNGNAGHRAFRAPLARALARRGFAVLLFDYRGYADNPGRPSEAGLATDARAARRFLEREGGASSDRIVYFGESLGAAVAVELALEHPPAALILRSPFTSLVDMGRTHYPFLPVRALLRDRYPSLERIGRVRSPVLVIAGERDRIVPVQQSRRLFDAAPEPKRFVEVPGADHNDADLLDGPLLVDETAAFARAALGG